MADLVAPEIERPDHHSVSSVQAYLRCPQKYKIKILDRAVLPTSGSTSSMSYGKCVHAGLEAAFVEHQGCGAGCATMAPHGDAARAAMEIAWAQEGMPTEGGDLLHSIERLYATLEALDAPDPADVLGVEWAILEPTPDGTLLKGFIDLLLRTPDGVEVRDWKVRSYMASPEALTADFQLGIYSGVVRRRYPDETIFISHYYPNKRAEVRVEASPHHEADALATFEATVEMIEADTVFAPRPDDECIRCECRPLCPAWADTEANEAMEGF